MADYDDIPTLKENIDRATVDSVLALDVDKYKYGFETDIESDMAPKGLSEDTVRFISAKKNEPEWMLEWRLEAYRRFLTMTEPSWAKVHYPQIDLQDMYYYAAPKSSPAPKSLDEVDPALIAMYDKLGVPLREREILAGVERPNVAVDAVMDSVSVVTTFREELSKVGIIFCSISEAIREYPELVQKYLASVVPVSDNYYATLNSAVFTDGSFVYIPKGVRCPMELSTYFRINEKKTGQFERTLIIAEADSYVSYLEGCTAPMRDEAQLHAAVVELVALDNAEIKYSTVQNWYPGDKDGKGGIYNFVTKRGDCRGDNSKISWTQVETGSAITWKYPSCILRGDGSRGEGELSTPDFMRAVKTAGTDLHIDTDMLKRPLNVGFSGGEKKRAEVLQMALLQPKMCILDETDSGLDIDALQVVSKGVNALRNAGRSMLVITHYQRLLNHIIPDVVHVFSDGKIVESGDKSLALQLEAKGYADFDNAAA